MTLEGSRKGGLTPWRGPAILSNPACREFVLTVNPNNSTPSECGDSRKEEAHLTCTPSSDGDYSFMRRVTDKWMEVRKWEFRLMDEIICKYPARNRFEIVLSIGAK